MRNDAYKTFIGRILSSNGTALAPSFTLDLTPPTPTLSGSIPLFPTSEAFKAYSKNDTGAFRVRKPIQNSRLFLSVIGSVGANDGYSVFKGGTLQSNWSAGVAITAIAIRKVKFYRREVDSPYVGTDHARLTYLGPIEKQPITQASMVSFVWVNLSLVYGQSNVQLFDTMTHTYDQALYNTTQKGVTLGANVNWYLSPSKYHCPWFNLYMQLGLKYVQQDNNIDSISPDNVSLVTYAYKGGNYIIEHTTTGSAYDSTSFKSGWSLNVPFQAIAMFNSTDHTFYVGIGFYNNISIPQRTNGFGLKPCDDMGILLNLPVATGGDGNAAANFALKLVWKDVWHSNDFVNSSWSTYRKDNFQVGFTVTVPLLISHKRPEPKS